MSTVSSIRATIARLKHKRAEARKKGNLRMIEDTKRREAQLERELVEEKWRERNTAIREKQAALKVRTAAAKKRKFNAKYGGSIKAAKSIGKGLSKLLKSKKRKR